MPAHWGFGLLAVLWLVTSLLALVRVRSRDFAAHREWMIRSYALCLAAVMLRIYMPLSAVAGIPFEDAYPAVAWLCWVPNLIVAEWFFVRSSFAPLKPRLGAVLVFTLMASSSPLLAQTAPDPGLPGVFSALEGSWEGTGTLLERPGVFEMSWESGPEGFVRLSFSNGWVASEGDGTPVLSARATYLVVTDSSALGVWIDDRPQRLTLDAVLTDSTIVTRWAAPAENGRTEYVVRSPASIVVRDYVIVDGADRLFSEAVYKRRTTQRPG
jgi:hypothetical protein